MGRSMLRPYNIVSDFSAGPEGAVVPVDAAGAIGHVAGDDRAGPVGGELTAGIKGPGAVRIGFVGQRVGVAAAANGATLRAVAAAIPGALDSRAPPATTSAAVIATRPEGAVGPLALLT